MRVNLPVTQREYDYPADRMLVSMTDSKGVITHCNHAFVETSGFTYESSSARTTTRCAIRICRLWKI